MLMRGNVSRVGLILVPPVDKSSSALSLLCLLSLPNSFCHAQKAGMFRNLFRNCLMQQKCWSDMGDSSFLLSVVRPLWNHCGSQSMNKATLAHSRIIRCPTLLLTFPHPCSNPPMTPRLTGQQMRGQYLRAWEDKDWIWAVCVHSNETLPSSGIGLRAVQLNLDVNTCWARRRLLWGDIPHLLLRCENLMWQVIPPPLQERVQILVFRCCCAWLFLLALWLLTFLLACLIASRLATVQTSSVTFSKACGEFMFRGWCDLILGVRVCVCGGGKCKISPVAQLHIQTWNTSNATCVCSAVTALFTREIK